MLCHAEEMITPSISNALSAAALLCPISVSAQRILFVFNLTNYKKQPCRLNDAEYHNYCTIFIRKHRLITADRVYTHVQIYVSLHRQIYVQKQSNYNSQSNMRVYIYVSGEYFTHLGFISGFFHQSLPVIGWTSDEITDKVMRHNIIFSHVLIKADF